MKNRSRIGWLIVAVLGLQISMSNLASADQVTNKLKQTLQNRLGTEHEIKSIIKAPIAGLYEVNVGSEIIYSDAQGEYVLIGNLINTQSKVNLSNARLLELNKINFASLPFAQAIKVIKGDGSRKIAVFSDPNCPYCRHIEDTLKQVGNVTIYTFLYPVLSADSTAKSKAIWCAPSRAKAWQAWMADKKAPSAATSECNTHAIDQNLALGKQLGVTGTPTIFLVDGRRLPGAISVEQLTKALVLASNSSS